MRILRTIVKSFILVVLDTWHDLSLRRAVAFELIGDDPRGTYRKPFNSLRKNLLAALWLRRLWTRMSSTSPS